LPRRKARFIDDEKKQSALSGKVAAEPAAEGENHQQFLNRTLL
jgi:hypothetical protein